MIYFFSEDVEMPTINIDQKAHWLSQVIYKNDRKEGNINFIFCSDTYLLEINKKYLNHDYYTDVITFDYCENAIVSGDIFISIDRISENSKTFNVSFDKELSRVLVHGVLHLLGYNDKKAEEKKTMTFLENKYLKDIE